MARRFSDTGIRQAIPPSVTNGRRLDALYAEAVRERRHLFVMTAGWHLADPSAVMAPGDINLDAETLVLLAGPGCYVCEQEWQPGLERTRCPGEPGRST
jgi:hypothetical protein